MKIVVVTCVKNEGPFLLEWIAFNRILGVTDFLFYSNDCTDGTAELLDALQDAGIVTHLPNPAVDNRNYQMAALKASRSHPLVENADWIWVTDVDEFLNIRTENGTIPELIEACGNPEAISVNFHMFANGGIEKFEDKPVISQFFKCHHEDEFAGEMAIEVKTLFKRNLDKDIKFYGAHRPFLRNRIDRVPHWSDGSGKQVARKFTFAATQARKRKFRSKGSRDLASLHHYTLRSLESYFVKTDRGDVNREHRVFEEEYWNERNDTSYSDDSMLRYMDRLTDEMNHLKKLPNVQEIHSASVVAHREKASKLMATQFYQDLKKKLISSDEQPSIPINRPMVKGMQASAPLELSQIAEKVHSRREMPSAPVEKTLLALSENGRKILSEKALTQLAHLASGRFAPHNAIGKLDQSVQGEDFTYVPKRQQPKGSTGSVVVACMKDEGPYILEWIAYHLAIGFDNFLIYTNDCSDGTVEILNTLQTMGVLTHVDNTKWKGQSPQQHALNKSIKHPLVLNSDWIAHFDTDEFVNIHVGNGRLDDLFAVMPKATNITMTWRLFGYNGVEEITDEPVIEKFDKAAPKYCPKPHNSWGFKTLTKNIGAYAKLGCHRPNKIKDEQRDTVAWFNGFGKEIQGKILDNGWRSDLRSIGYDVVQLNHYAVRSAQGFLVKRQRGRALQVNRSIGLAYWTRMDFNTHPDASIKRNLPRVVKVLEELKANPKLLELHNKSLEYHQRKAKELLKVEEFRDLYHNITNRELNDLERVALVLTTEEQG